MAPHFNLGQLNHCFRKAPPAEVVTWAAEHFGDTVIATSSFQTQSLPLLHHISLYAPDIEIVFLDTGFHFPETLAYRDHVAIELGLPVRSVTSQLGHQGFMQRYGPLYSRDPDLCCYINKVDPLKRFKIGKNAWITGIRRDQTAQRSEIDIVAPDADGGYKIAPFAYWNEGQIYDYIRTHNLPEHPLLRCGYRSIGCQPCTRAVARSGDYRAGRWENSDKTECGLHADYFVRRSTEKEPS